MNPDVRDYLNRLDLKRDDLIQAAEHFGLKLPIRKKERDAMKERDFKELLNRHYDARNLADFWAKLRKG
jgi:DNA-binding TFAR19-related protein (PDSD5 family)